MAKVKTSRYAVEKLSVEVGMGVLAKDGTPFNPGIIMATSLGGVVVEGGEPIAWSSPYEYSVTALLGLIFNERYSEIKVVDENNVQWLIRK